MKSITFFFKLIYDVLMNYHLYLSFSIARESSDYEWETFDLIIIYY